MENKDRFEVSEEVEVKIFEHASKFSMPALLNAIEAFNKATADEHANWHPGLGLELAFTSYLVTPEPQSQGINQPTAPVSEKPSKMYQAKSETTPKPRKSNVQTAEASSTRNKPQHIDQPEEVDNEPDAPSQTTEQVPEKDSLKIEGKITISEVHQAWQDVKDRVGQHNRRTEGLLNTAKLTGVDGNALILGFSSDTLKNMMTKEGNITLTADILEEVLGQPMTVKCIVTTHEGSALPKNIKIEKDGMVSTATRDLGGKISSAEEIEE
jgi:hypothetical protein